MQGISTSQILLNAGVLSGNASTGVSYYGVPLYFQGNYNNIYIDAGAMTPPTGAFPTATTYTVSGQQHTVDSFYFDNLTEQSLYFKFAFPDIWDKGQIKSKIYWDVSTGLSTGVVWGLSAGNFAYNSGFDANLGTEIPITGIVLQNNKLHITNSNFITINNTSGVSNLAIFKIARKVSDNADTYSGAARLLGINLQWKETLGQTPLLW